MYYHINKKQPRESIFGPVKKLERLQSSVTIESYLAIQTN
jgi:hypothetical protein